MMLGKEKVREGLLESLWPISPFMQMAKGLGKEPIEGPDFKFFGPSPHWTPEQFKALWERSLGRVKRIDPSKPLLPPGAKTALVHPKSPFTMEDFNRKMEEIFNTPFEVEHTA